MSKREYIAKRFHFLLSIFLLIAGNIQTVKAQSTNYKSYALYVYNFMKYIEWPENNSNSKFVIALIGNSPIEKEFELLAKNKKLSKFSSWS